MNNVLHCRQIVASISDLSAGPSYSVVSLANHIARRGVVTGLDTVSGWRVPQAGAAMPCPGETGDAPDVEISHYPLSSVPLLKKACASGPLQRALTRFAGQADILHTHGLWLMPNVYPSWAAGRRGARAKVVVSPRGMLGPAALAFSRWKKTLFWLAFQRHALKHTSMLHATSDSEYEDIRAFGLSQPVAIIPNGIDMQADLPRDGKAGKKLVLSLGRIHPKKALDQLILAWAKIEPRHPDWQLRLVGPSELGYADQLQQLASQLGLKNVVISAPVFGKAKFELMQSAQVFVLPTLNENFAMTVAESLAVGTPVIATKGAPWEGLQDNGCGWWIDHGSEALAQALRTAMSLDDEERRQMGERGRAWMERDFSWSAIAERMIESYRYVCRGHEPPAWVRLA